MIKINSQITHTKQLAYELYEAGQLDEAEKLCKQLCNIEPKDSSNWVLRAGIHGLLKQFKEAKLYAKQAIKLSPGNVNAHTILGDSYAALKNPEKAIESYQQSLNLDPENVDAICNLCNIYVYKHELLKARKIIEQTLKYNPKHPDINYYAAVLDRRFGNLDAAKTRLNTLLDNKLPVNSFVKISNELGKILEELEEYNGAFKAYEASQQAYMGEYFHGAELIFDEIKKQKLALQITQPTTWKKVGSKNNRPDPIFLVSFPRSGTTLLEQILSSHSQISVTGEDSILNDVIAAIPDNNTDYFYPNNLHLIKPVEIRKLREIYWKRAASFIKDKPFNQRLVDKLPLNIIHLPFIYRLFPNAHIIFAIRDPRDVCLSCYTNIFDANPAMVNFSDQQKTTDLYNEIISLWIEYKKQLQINIHEIRYEDLIVNTESTVRKLINFLALEWESNTLDYHKKKNRRNVDTPSYEGVILPVYSSSNGRWRKFEKNIPLMLKLLEPSLKYFHYE